MTLLEIRPLAHAQGSAENPSANLFSSLGVSAPLMAGSVSLSTVTVLGGLPQFPKQIIGQGIRVLRNELIEAAGELFRHFERGQKQFGADFVFQQVRFDLVFQMESGFGGIFRRKRSRPGFCGTNWFSLLLANSLRLLKLVEGFVEGAFVAGAIADVEGNDGKLCWMFGDDSQLDLAGLLQTPVIEAYFVDQGLFDVIGGLEIAAVAFAHLVVFRPFFGCKAQSAGAEIVFAGVLAGNGLAGLGAGPGGCARRRGRG